MDVNLTIADPRISTVLEQLNELQQKLTQLIEQGVQDMARDQEALDLIQQLNDTTNQMAENEAAEAGLLEEVRQIMIGLRSQLEGGVTAGGTDTLLNQLNDAITRQQQALSISQTNQDALRALGTNPEEPIPPVEPVEPTE
jgi:seryl-tRNA synthetase